MRKTLVNSVVPALLLAGTLLFNQSCGTRTDKPPASDGGSLEGTVSISGAFALYPLTVKWAEEFQKLHPGVRIDISAGGAGKGMTDALSGMVDLGMFSRGITQAEKDQGCWWVAVAKDAVLPTINASNPYLGELMRTGATQEQFRSAFLDKQNPGWSLFAGGAGDRLVNVYTRSDACGAAQMWGEFLGTDQEGLNGIGVFGDPGMADAVRNDVYGLGYNNVIYVYDLASRKCYDGLSVLPLDRNGNGMIDMDERVYNTLDDVMAAIRDGVYPSPPARDLYFVSKGRPGNPAVVAFLRWVLTKGQQHVGEAGYVNLPPEKIADEMKKLRD